MSYRYRISALMLLDSLFILTALLISDVILQLSKTTINPVNIISAITLVVSYQIFAYFFKLYKRAWEYASIGELISITKTITYAIITTVIVQYIYSKGVQLRDIVITWMMLMLSIGGSRFSWRLFRDKYINKSINKKRALIIGAGAAGAMVVRQLKHNHECVLYPVGFIDDDRKKHKLEILGVPVFGGIEQIEQVVIDKEIEHIIIAIPSLDKRGLNRIFDACSKTKIKTQIIPKIEDLMIGKVSINEFRDVQVEDLLGREPVELDVEDISEYITDQTVLVTGAGGSIGSEICRQIVHFIPSKLILLGHGENSIYEIELELRDLYAEDINIETEIVDIKDREKMFTIMEKHRPSVVFHAAAHKHVPLMERNPDEAVKNNIIGTKNTAEAASAHQVKTFVMISTDKAVNPTSVMGATKRIAEMLIQHMDSISNTTFVAVRFGNVLGSRGSVIPLFKDQIKRGGPVTVTDPDMVRYFMTIPEASRLVIQAGALANGGETFVLDMGEPVKIVDLANNLIKLSGYTEDEIEIEYTGIRPGEKLFEELLSKNEVHEQQIYPNIYVGKSIHMDYGIIEDFINNHMKLKMNELRKELNDIANFKKRDSDKVLMV